MDKLKKTATGAVTYCIIIVFFLLINISFYLYIRTNKILEKSGEEYLEREEHLFSEVLKEEGDYVEQIFSPLQTGLEVIKIRLALNCQELKDEIRLLIELRQGDEVIQSKEVNEDEISNWRYYDLMVEEVLDPGKEYSLRISQPEGPRQKDGKYWISYVIFHAVEHVAENVPGYFYNGEKVEGEFEVSYIYRYSDDRLAFCLAAADMLFIAVIAALVIVKKQLKMTEKNRGRIAAAVYFALPLLGFVAVEVIAGNLLTMTWWNAFKNILIYYMSFFLISILLHGMGELSIVFLVFCAVAGLVQYFVYLFRGSVFGIHDIFSLKTAITVAGKYVFAITPAILFALVVLLCAICVCTQIKRKVFTVQRKLFFAMGTAIVMVSAGGINGGYLMKINMWDPGYNYRNGGVLLTLVSELQYLTREKPEEYSVEKVQAIMEEVEAIPGNSMDTVPDNIILIMNESFADLEIINKIATDTELLPNIKSMDKNAIKGNLAMPVFGAETANSEYEVLTGNTMAFLSGGSIAYQLDVQEDELGMVSILKQQGYEAVALHPYAGENWNRSEVYEDMGFDRFISEENWGDMERLRWCASDKAAYDKVIEICEETKGKLFTFLVTMQNHGGYGQFEGYENTLELNYDEDYPEAEQYLSLLQESDRAFGELTEYFSEVDEPTMIIMFGDHQAAIENEFYEKLFGKSLDELQFWEEQLLYMTPFIIWTNYASEEDKDVFMSSNFFGSYVLERAGVRLAPYNRFLLKLREEIPIICPRGICGMDGIWHVWEEVPEDEAGLIEEYKILQYNNVYDRKNRVNDCFTIESGL